MSDRKEESFAKSRERFLLNKEEGFWEMLNPENQQDVIQ